MIGVIGGISLGNLFSVNSSCWPDRLKELRTERFVN